MDRVKPYTKAQIKKIRGAVPSISNMRTSSGNDAPNQFIIRTENGVYFQSYSRIIAYRPYGGGPIVLDNTYWDYSQTTGKYRNDFLGEGIQETREGIESGRYQLADLN